MVSGALQPRFLGGGVKSAWVVYEGDCFLLQEELNHTAEGVASLKASTVYAIGRPHEQ